MDRLGPPASGPTLACCVGRKPLKGEKGRNNHLYKGGVTALKILESGDFIVGAGNGKVTQGKLIIMCSEGKPNDMISEYGPQMRVRGQVTSILLSCEDVLVGSTMNEIYYARLGCLDGTKMVNQNLWTMIYVQCENCASQCEFIYLLSFFLATTLWWMTSLSQMVTLACLPPAIMRTSEFGMLPQWGSWFE